MSTELTINKERIAGYVHDVAQIETAIFTLERAICDCREKRNLLRNEAQAALANAKSKLDKAQTAYNTAQVERIKLVNGRKSLLLSIVQNYRKGGHDDQSERTQKLMELTAIVEKAEACLAEKQAEYDFTIAFRGKSEISAKVIDAQMTLLKNAQAQIRNYLTRCYATDLIPLKYRYVECALIMDALFRADDSASLATATKRCDLCLFEHPHFKHSYQAHLGKMTVGPAEIIAARESVQSFVRGISEEVSEIAWQTAEGIFPADNFDALIKNTRLSQYAAEQVEAAVACLCKY